MSVKRAAKLVRRHARQEKKRESDLHRRVNDAMKVLHVVAEVGGGFTDEEGTTRLTEAAYRGLALPKNELYRTIRERLLSARNRR